MTSHVFCTQFFPIEFASSLTRIARNNSAISSAGALRSYRRRRKRASSAASALSEAELGPGAVGIGPSTVDICVPGGRADTGGGEADGIVVEDECDM